MKKPYLVTWLFDLILIEGMNSKLIVPSVITFVAIL